MKVTLLLSLISLSLVSCSGAVTMRKVSQLTELSFFEGCVSHNGEAPVTQMMCQRSAHQWRVKMESR